MWQVAVSGIGETASANWIRAPNLAPNRIIKAASTEYDAVTIATYVIYACSAFMFIPAGRDVIAPGTEVMPGDDKLLSLMWSNKKTQAYDFTWRTWGFNWCLISAVNIMAVRESNATFIKIATAGVLFTLAMLLKEKDSFAKGGADLTPFLALYAAMSVAFLVLVNDMQ